MAKGQDMFNEKAIDEAELVEIDDLAFLTVEDVLKQDDPDWLIEDVLPDTGIASIFGESDVGKSVLAIDMATSISSGTDWFGKSVKKAPVLYCVLEGAGGFKNRLRANIASGKNLEGDLYFYMQTLELKNKEMVAKIIQKALSKGVKNGVIIIDTLNRASLGLDENDSKSMGILLASLQKIVNATSCLVIIIHHSGKDPRKGLRGHSSLHAAMDAVIEVKEVKGQKIWRVTKLKDGQKDTEYGFRLNVVQVGENKQGKIMTSCVVQSLPHTQSTNTADFSNCQESPKKLGYNQQVAWDAITELMSQKSEIIKANFGLQLEDAVAVVKGNLTCAPQHRAARARLAISDLVQKGFLVLQQGKIQINSLRN